MKTIKALILSCVLTAGFVHAEDATPADQKWLAAVEKKVASGQTDVSTPEERRAKMLEQWAKQNGYATQTVKSEKGYRLEITKSVAKR